MNPVSHETKPNVVKIIPNKGVVGSRAGFWRRAVAATIDGIIVGMGMFPIHVLVIIIYKVSHGMTAHQALMNHGLVTNIINFGLNIVGIYFYFGYFYSTRGATPGKILLGLKVLSARGGKYLTYNEAFFREFFGKTIIDTLTLGIGYLIVGFRKDKLALHDIIFETQVIKQNT